MKLLNKQELCKFLSAPLGKRIDQHAVEQWSQSYWNIRKSDKQYYNDVTNNQKEIGNFVMMLPPPNITGNLHLGHALTVSIEDAIIRYKNMSGMQAQWIPGFDHAGLATQSIVEKILLVKKGVTRQQLGREEFTKFSNKWKDLKRDEMRQQLDRLGLDLDYDREFFTTDEKSSYAVQMAFRELFNKGYIYRSLKPIHWSKELGTTLSDIEITIDKNGVKRYFRTNEIVETREVSQWFINCKDIAKKAVEVVQDSSIKMIPKNYVNSWSSWLLENGVHDWCISRQSWWGHHIPAYKSTTSPDTNESWVMADNECEARAKLQCSDVMQDPDVLDTWFSSSLLPLTISGWPNRAIFEENCSNGKFPLDIMETGFDILTFWVSKMVMICLALEAKIPFNLILLHGMICDSKGKKMSKSKGNVIDPNDLINGTSLSELQTRTKESQVQGLISEEQMSLALDNQKRLFPNGIPACGADGLRAYLLSQDFQEEVIRVQIPQIEKIRRLMNKLWNIYRFSIMLIENTTDKEIIPKELENVLDLRAGGLDLLVSFDEFDISLLDNLIKCQSLAREAFEETYYIHNLVTRLELFLNSSLSSEYLPKLRICLNDASIDRETHKRKLGVLVHTLVTSAKLLHPIMPHVTEFLYQKLYATLTQIEDAEITDDQLFTKMGSIHSKKFPENT